MDEQRITELVQVLEKYELTVAALYDTCASVLPESREAWLVFAAEERLHAQWIGALHTHLKGGRISFEQTRFTVQSVQTAIGYIEGQIARIASGKIDLSQSLHIAIGIERSLLESAFFRVFNLTGDQALKLRARLVEATRTHLDQLVAWQRSLGHR
jgi:hypothetical protein